MRPKRQKPVCLITGVGDATGSALVRRFVSGGYTVAMIARDAQRLNHLAAVMPDAHAFPCDVADLQALQETVAQVQAQLGAVEVLLYNAVAHSFGTFLQLKPETLERNFRVNTTALLYLARQLAPAMIEAARGCIIATGNTAAHRGVPNYALFAPTKAAQRVLCEALARELGPQRIHVAYVTIDAPIDVTWLGETDEQRPPWLVPPEDWPHKREDFFAHPDAIAEEVFHISQQHHTAWSFDSVIRPFAESW